MVEGDAPIASAISQTPPHLGDAGNERFAQFTRCSTILWFWLGLTRICPTTGSPPSKRTTSPQPTPGSWTSSLCCRLLSTWRALKGTLDKDRHVTDGAQIQGHQVPRRNHNYSRSTTRALCNPTWPPRWGGVCDIAATMGAWVRRPLPPKKQYPNWWRAATLEESGWPTNARKFRELSNADFRLSSIGGSTRFPSWFAAPHQLA